jgi:hypothetical protein
MWKIEDDLFGKLNSPTFSFIFILIVPILCCRHSKVMNITHRKLKMQQYLENKFMVSLRSRMINVKVKYREKHAHVLCPCCRMKEHLLSCSKIKGILVSSVPVYQDLFGSNIEKQVNLTRILRKRFKKRKMAPKKVAHVTQVSSYIYVLLIWK